MNISQVMLSIYIHWPFCISKCPYCDFNSHVLREVDHDIWLNRYLQELKKFLSVYAGRKIKSIFFGGGTPSLMQTRVVYEIINFISKNAIVSDNTEITLEANPTSIENTKLKEFRKAGVNRVSIGIQSLDNNSLKFLGRNHSAEEALESLEFANKYFDNVSFDIIYGLPHQDLNAWRYECEKVMKYVTNHVSLYQLMIEPNTKFYSMYKAKKLIPHKSDTLSDMYEYTNNELLNRGLCRYEVSNYASKGYESQHNMAYWKYDEYLGIGPGAHSRLLYNSLKLVEGVQREKILDQYAVIAMNQGSNPKLWIKGENISNFEYINKAEVAKEMVLMNLRTIYGLSLEKFKLYTGLCFEDNFKGLLSNFKDSDLLYIKDGFVILTSKGIELNSYIVKELYDFL